jgi:N-acetyl-anhydromuramyl-L-alanine amidase AmpD
MIETDNWTFVQARWYTKTVPGVRRVVNVGCIHDMEYPERPTAAEDIAHDFATRTEAQKSSAHICVDSDTIVQCVHDNDVAFAAPPRNSDGIHIEIPGFHSQTAAQWTDPYSNAALANAAEVAAQYCLKYNLPCCHLTNTQLKAGERGWVGHNQISAVYGKTDHADPGPFFPWDAFMELMAQRLQARKLKYGVK